MNEIKKTSFVALSITILLLIASETSAQIQKTKKTVSLKSEKNLIDFFLPMQAQGKLVSEGTWGD